MNARTKTLLIGIGIVFAGILPLFLYGPAFNQPPPASESLPLTSVGWLEQWLVVITAFVLKPAHMLLSLLCIIWLWHRRAADLVALRWGLICFVVGEAFCAANYLFLNGCSNYVDYVHSYSMAVSYSFFAYALLEGIDSRLIKYSAHSDRCAALSLCRSCVKYTDAPCGLRRLFALLIPALIAVAFILPCYPLKSNSVRAAILGTVADFLNPLWSQLFENRYCAWAAIALLLASWLVLLLKRVDPVTPAKILFAAAMGPLGFGLTRLFLRGAFSDHLPWANAWEELTEFLFVIAVGFVLWVFRSGLFRDQEPARAPVGMVVSHPKPAGEGSFYVCSALLLA